MDSSNKEIKRVARQLTASYKGPGWYGPALLETLNGVTAEVASRHPVEGAHSIWEIVRHLTAWQRESVRVLAGKQYETLQGDADWPPVAASSDQAWQEALKELDSACNELVAAIRTLGDDALDKPVPGRDFTMYVLLHGLVQHNIYHAGQIAILKK